MTEPFRPDDQRPGGEYYRDEESTQAYAGPSAGGGGADDAPGAETERWVPEDDQPTDPFSDPQPPALAWEEETIDQVPGDDTPTQQFPPLVPPTMDYQDTTIPEPYDDGVDPLGDDLADDPPPPPGDDSGGDGGGGMDPWKIAMFVL